MAKMSVVDWIAWVLVMVGGLNWGLTGFGFNLVNAILGSIPLLENIVYWLVGLSALYLIIMKFTKKE
jgi:uncharacterized membrane protein YuzA (DUF378 family)